MWGCNFWTPFFPCQWLMSPSVEPLTSSLVLRDPRIRGCGHLCHQSSKKIARVVLVFFFLWLMFIAICVPFCRLMSFLWGLWWCVLSRVDCDSFCPLMPRSLTQSWLLLVSALTLSNKRDNQVNVQSWCRRLRFLYLYKKHVLPKSHLDLYARTLSDSDAFSFVSLCPPLDLSKIESNDGQGFESIHSFISSPWMSRHEVSL